MTTGKADAWLDDMIAEMDSNILTDIRNSMPMGHVVKPEFPEQQVTMRRKTPKRQLRAIDEDWDA